MSTASGAFTLDDAIPLVALKAAFADDSWANLLRPADSCLPRASLLLGEGHEPVGDGGPRGEEPGGAGVGAGTIAAYFVFPDRMTFGSQILLMALFALNRLTQVFRPADESATAQPAPQEGDL